MSAAKRVDTTVLPWERQPGEPEAAWGAFMLYRDAGPLERSFSQVARISKRSPANYARMSQTWQWVERVTAYDAEQDRKKRAADDAAIFDMRKRHIEAAMAMQGLGALVLNKLVGKERAKDKDGQPLEPNLKPSEARDYLELGMALERLNRGEPVTITRQDGATVIVNNLPAKAEATVLHDFSKLSLDDLKALRELTMKARARPAKKK